jgi:hypothetical protein
LSKWNPIEHRLFSFISGNCAGTPLRTWELFLVAIRGTTTKAGLTVEAVLHPNKYQTGWMVTETLMRTLNLEPHATRPAGATHSGPANPHAHGPQSRKLLFNGD